tara:strand:+ start:2377 stop:2703 length:327 start_codon:yes stop_codon:yes gene_type:complete
MEEINQLENMMAPEMGMNQPTQMNAEMPGVSSGEISEAKAALAEIRVLVQEMMASGMSEEEINQFLQQFGISLQDLAFAEQTIENPEVMNQMNLSSESNIDSMLNDIG